MYYRVQAIWDRSWGFVWQLEGKTRAPTDPVSKPGSVQPGPTGGAMPGGAAWKDAVSLHDLEALARAAMDPGAFDFVAGGAGDEVTLRENAAAFARRRLWPRVLTGVVGVDTSATMLGAPVSMPVGLAPAALQGLAHPDGEIAAARAAASAGVVYCLSTVSAH